MVTNLSHGDNFALHGDRFGSRRVAENYSFRPPYSREVYGTLLSLIGAGPRAVLDAGCGSGKITLGLVDDVERVDAVDPSIEMLKVARRFPGAANPKIRWINARMEEAPLDPPYGLIVASLSIHWMDLDRVLSRFAEALADRACLAVLDGDAPVDAPWEREETAFMVDFLERIDGRPRDWWKTMGERLAEPVLVHPAFQSVGHRVTAPVQFSQSVADHLRCQHSRAAWSEDHLGEKASREFDTEITKLLNRYAVGGMLTFVVQTRMEWGRVLRI
ncbi:MAG TPA: class I SAM-dependent methyltransferase [Candidatus Binataceae bacterium]